LVAHGRGPAADREREQRTAVVAEELRELLAASQAPDGATPDEATRLRERRLREQLVVLNVPVATSIALRYRGRGEAIEDLVQAAHLGLVKAANGFVPGKGPDFLAYATPTISGEVKRYFRDQSWAIRPPRRVQELRPDVERASSELTQELGRSPRVGELARHLGVSQDDVIECLASTEVYNVHSLDAPMPGAEDLSFADTIGEDDHAMDLFEDLVSLKPLLEKLPPRDRRILALRFFHEQTQQQIADQVGVTQMQVSRLLTRALGKLREGMEDERSDRRAAAS
jgi:RNA polymerase sigma-B factor